MRHDPKIALAILSLSSTGAPWDTFLAALKEMETKALNELVAASDDTVFGAQGRVRAIREILLAIDKARTVADRQS